jgi:regulatory protein
VKEVLKRLAKVKLIDDAAFAAFWLENRSTFRPRGRRALRMELRLKGVLDEVIEVVLEDVDELDNARRVACDKADRLRGLPVSEQRRKLRGFLSRRGFEYDIISDVIDEMNSENYDSEE